MNMNKMINDIQKQKIKKDAEKFRKAGLSDNLEQMIEDGHVEVVETRQHGPDRGDNVYGLTEKGKQFYVDHIKEHQNE